MWPRIALRGVTLALVLLLAGCANLIQEVPQESREEAVTATRIKSRLLEAPDLDAAAISVQTRQGRVTLTGFVETQQQKQKAERLAKQVEGVSEVVNEIEVKE